jgi:cysteine-rich repeat protein
MATMGATYCDDGDTDDGDGCSSTCTVETGWTCSGGSSTSPSVCDDICGDGKRMNSPHSNYCDDGSSIADDGCDNTCNIDPKWN